MTERRFRILSLAPTSFFNDYGCHVRILEEARALQRRGHEVTILTYFKGRDVPSLRIIRTHPTPWHADYEVGSSRHKLVFDVLLALRLVRVLARNRFDVIHGHLHEGALLGGRIGRLFSVPCVMDYQGSLSDEMRLHGFLRAGGLREKFWRWMEQRAENSAHTIITSTTHAAQNLRAAPAGRVLTLLDGVSTSFVRPDVLSHEQRVAKRAELGLEPKHSVVAFLGLLAEHQGIQNIIETAALLAGSHTQARWLVMGYPGESVWRKRAHNLGLADRMIFPGRVDYEQMPSMLALADVAVAPKLSLTEGSGKLLNYMAMALPIVAFDTPAQRELLGDCGWYASVGDSAEFARQVAFVLDNPSAAHEAGARARTRAGEDFDWDRSAIVLEKVYSNVVRNR